MEHIIKETEAQFTLFGERRQTVRPFRTQLLKWVGSKQRLAHEIVSYFPGEFATYREPFLGSGAVLGTLAPKKAVASDAFAPLMQIWRTLRDDPEELIEWYSVRWHRMKEGDKKSVYEQIKSSYNAQPNGADLLFLCRCCYGGIVRFRKADGHISTPCGAHNPISPESFAKRAEIWRRKTSGASFAMMDYTESMGMARAGDLIYCDPPYSHTQSILYGAQMFNLESLLKIIAECKSKGAFVALSIDGRKRSGRHLCHLPIPDGLFEREIFLDCGRSMLKRFQMQGESLEEEVVADRLLLTY
ncbi:MAG TPA: Dam family site-specific DNA-(adenine-N6)-methyltransferase [Planctomycetota bacterium]|nr:Dam family site-specific DNA-(adenine-N6)-methyltransferase [Planctomycetota bacterium]